jgi:endonuclease/exonuclease/phosphatase family metal-dependent hydrolase
LNETIRRRGRPAGVLLLQEIESYPEEGACRASRLAERLGMAYAYAPARGKGDGTHGLAILSAFPIEDLEVMWLPEADVPRTGAPRIAIQADVVLDGGRRLHVVDLHLDTTLNVGERLVHLRPAVIDPPDPIVVGGDFNTNDFAWAGDAVPLLPLDSAIDTAQAPAVDELMDALGYAAPTAALGPTEERLGVESRLDSIYVRGVTAVDAGVARDGSVSDHWPLWLVLELAAE